MYKVTLKIDGMHCGMCEAHVNDAVRKAAAVKKVKSSHRRGETVYLCEEEEIAPVLQAVEALGYRVLHVGKAPFEKGSIFCRKS